MLMGTAHIMLSRRHANRGELANLTPQLFQHYLNYLLSDYVHNLAARNECGDPVAVPAWLQSLGETTLTALVTPSFHLGAVPGVPDGLSVRVAARDVSALDGYQMVRGAMTAR